MSRGFTLLELLVAMTILLLGLLAIYLLNNTSRTASIAAEELAFVQLACQTKMNELLASNAHSMADSVEAVPNTNGWTISVTTFSVDHQGVYGARITARKRGTTLSDANGTYELVRWFLTPRSTNRSF